MRGLLRREGLSVLQVSGLCWLWWVYELWARGLPSVVTHSLHVTYGLTPWQYAWVLLSFFVGYVPMQILTGMSIGRMTLSRYRIGLLLMSVVALWMLANSMQVWWVIAARFCLGVGVSFIFVACLTRIAWRVNPAQLTLTWGVALGLSLLVAGLGYWALGAVEHWLGWRLLIHVVALFGLLLVAITALCAGSTPRVIEPQHWPSTWRTLCHYAVHPRQIMLGILAALLSLPMLLFEEGWGAEFVQHLPAMQETSVSWMLGFNYLGLALGAPCVGWWYDRTQQHQYLLNVSAVMMTILLASILYVPDLSWPMLALFLTLLGFFSAAVLVLFALSCRGVPQQHWPLVFGLVNGYSVISSVAIGLVGALLQGVDKQALAELFEGQALSHYQAALLVLPLASILAVIMTFYLPEAD